MNETEREDVARRLAAHRNRIQAVMDMIGNKNRFTPDEREALQAAFRELKKGLREEADAMNTASGRQDLNRTERAFYEPAVTKAAVQLRAAWNSDPIRSDWCGQLYAARMDIEFLLRQLRPDPA